MYDIRFDEDQRLILLKLEGFWHPETIADFSAALVSKAKEVGRRSSRPFSMLSDGTNFPVQSAMVATGFVDLMNQLSPIVTGRMAIVASSTLNRMQAQRIFTDPKIEVFATREEATAWLEGTY